jgi:heat shock protein HspQ
MIKKLGDHMTTFKFELGSLLKDEITGFEGICYNRSEWFYNTNVYGLKPITLKDGKIEEVEHFDEPQVYEIGKPLKNYICKPFKFELGEEVKDIFTPFTGFIMSRTNWLNGCASYGVKPKTLKDNIPQEIQHFSEGNIEKIVVLEEDIKEKESPKENRTGGPVPKIKSTNRF